MSYYWRQITDRCTHCGERMEARNADEKGLEYRHLETGSCSCTVTYQAEPFSRWGQHIDSRRHAPRGSDELHHEVGKRLLALSDQLVSGYPMEGWDSPNNGRRLRFRLD